jgi:hypothetical protein
MAEVSLKAQLVEKVENYFNENGWNSYEYDERYYAFRAGVSLKCKLKSTRMTVFCRDAGIVFQFPISIGTDDENEIQTMEFITRANYGLTNGGFQMDLDNNHIEYTVFVPCEDEPSMNAISAAIRTGLWMLERYGDELLAVMFGMKNAKDAIEAAERKGR